MEEVITVWNGLEAEEPVYRLSLTNHEVKRMFRKLIAGWFKKGNCLSHFIKAMLCGDEEEMNDYMNEVALNTFSSIDVIRSPSDAKHPERFYHGFVLGLMVDKAGDYILKSNRESGYGRYDVVMEPKDADLLAHGIPHDRILKYGFAFEGEKCLIRKG